MENKRIKLNSGEWCNDDKNKEYQEIIELNLYLKNFMKETLEVELRYKEFRELMDYPNDVNNHTDWWGQVRTQRNNEIDGLFYSSKEAVTKAYEETKSEMFMFEKMKQHLIDYGCGMNDNGKFETDDDY